MIDPSQYQTDYKISTELLIQRSICLVYPRQEITRLSIALSSSVCFEIDTLISVCFVGDLIIDEFDICFCFSVWHLGIGVVCFFLCYLTPFGFDDVWDFGWLCFWEFRESDFPLEHLTISGSVFPLDIF